MGCVQCKDKEATKLTDDRDTSISQSATGFRYGADPTPQHQHYPSFGVTAIPNFNNFQAPVGQGITVFGGVHTSSHTGTLRTRGGTGRGFDMFPFTPLRISPDSLHLTAPSRRLAPVLERPAGALHSLLCVVSLFT